MKIPQIVSLHARTQVFFGGLLLLSAQMLWAGMNTNLSTATMKVYESGIEKLTAYTDVPGHDISIINGYPSRAKSDIYEIWVRSAATDNVWVQCFANMTYNRGMEMPLLADFQTPTSIHAYQRHTAGWTHTYANFEMSENSPVEVEIRKVGSTLLNGSTGIVKSAVHPSHKVVAGSKKDENGRVYFKINQPGQIVIDINGQMDDHNAAFPSTTPGGRMPSGSPVHSVAIYANPIMEMPVAGPANTIVTISPLASSPTNRLVPPDPATYNTLEFAPGVHNIGPGFKVYPGKSYYIPGDAILYGNITNDGVSKGAFRSSGDRINIYGYGTICGIQIPHYQNATNDDTATGTPNPEYPEWFALPVDNREGGVGITLQNSWDIKVTGVTIADPANFNTKIDGQHNRTNDISLMSWVKLHSWRVNGDGCGGYIEIEDSFFRTSDDSTYVRDWRRRCTFWKDTNANIFRFINFISGGVEDCDILYSRWRATSGVGSVFAFETNDGIEPETVDYNVAIRNLRFHDKLSNPKHIISLGATQTFLGATFESIKFYLPLNNQLSEVLGSAVAPYTGVTMFKNITFQNPLDGSNPVKLTRSTYSDYFETNAYVDEGIFESAFMGQAINAYDFNLESHPTDANQVRRGTTNVGYIRNGTWIAFEDCDFENGVSSFTVNASSASAGGTIELRLGSSTGTLIGSVALANTGGWNTYASFSTTALEPVAGVQDLYLVFRGATTGYLFNLASFIFQPAPVTFTLATNAANGSIALTPPGGTYATGTVVTVSATPNSGYTFGNWSGDLTGSVNPTTIMMNGNKTVTANFNAVTYTLTENSPNGSVTFTPPGGVYTSGQVVTVSANPDSGYTFGSWSGDLTGSVNPTTIVMNGNKTVLASFTANGEAVPWFVNFNGLPLGTTRQGAPTTWEATRAGIFRVSGERLEVTGGGGQGVYTSGVIDISGGSVDLSLDLQSAGALEAAGNGVDYIRIYIKVDGGIETLVRSFLGPQSATTWTTNGITGTTLQVVIRTVITAPDEFYYLDNLHVGYSAPGDLFTGWAGAGVNFDDDTNKDGVKNGVAWLLGATDPSASATDLLPKAPRNADSFVLEFHCLNASDRGTAVLELEYSNDLSQPNSWIAVAIPGEVGTFSDGAVNFAVTDPAPSGGLLKVIATIPVGESAAGKLFTRIKGVK